MQVIVLEKKWNLLALEGQPDHMCLIVSAPPAVAPAEIVKAVKGILVKRLLMRYPELTKKTCRGTL